MTPTIVHRYAFPIREAVEALLGDAVGDCQAWRIRIEGDDVVIDVVAPAPGIAPSMEDLASLASNEAAKSYAADSVADFRGKSREEPHKHGPDAEPDFPADEQSGETSPESELKGGPLARRAAIACGERGFWTFLGVSSVDEAKADVCRRCGITTRKMLDHDDRAAAVWHDIDGKYRLWLEGHDVELD
ncbi:MAG: hypothetical protein J0H34_20690 [Rhizobiales bacterium]|nr:hypothetical protein [Hyphomicrobiales bacterium]